MNGHIAKLLFCALFCIGFGLYTIGRGITAGTREEFDVAALESGSRPNSAWLRLSGVARADLEVVNDEESGRRLVPFVSKTWSPLKNVAVVLELKQDENLPQAVTQDGIVEGMLVIGRGICVNGITRFAAKDVRTAKDYILLAIGTTPKSRIIEGEYWIAGGLVALGIWYCMRRYLSPSRSN